MNFVSRVNINAKQCKCYARELRMDEWWTCAYWWAMNFKWKHWIWFKHRNLNSNIEFQLSIFYSIFAIQTCILNDPHAGNKGINTRCSIRIGTSSVAMFWCRNVVWMLNRHEVVYIHKRAIICPKIETKLMQTDNADVVTSIVLNFIMLSHMFMTFPHHSCIDICKNLKSGSVSSVQNLNWLCKIKVTFAIACKCKPSKPMSITNFLWKLIFDSLVLIERLYYCYWETWW